MKTGLINRRSFSTAAIIFPFSKISNAQSFPSRPITIVVPFAAGSSTDAVTRVVAQQLAVNLKNSVVVENRTGAGNAIGGTYAARSAPDGHTLMTTELTYVISPGLLAKPAIDPKRDFVEIITLASVPHVMAIHPDIPAKNLKEFISYCKDNPGKLNFGSGGLGSNPHMCGELFKVAAGVELTHVPYKGAAAAAQDLLAGQIQMLCSSIPTMLPHIKSGKLRALMVTSDKRSEVLPEIPSAIEVGLPEMVANFWIGLAAPAKTPSEVVTKLNIAAREAINTPELQSRLKEMGMTPVGNTPEEATKFVHREVARWAATAKAANIKVE